MNGVRRHRIAGPGRQCELECADRVLVTLAVLRLQIPHAGLALMFEVDRSTITRAVHQVRPLLAVRGFATPEGHTLPALADVFAYGRPSHGCPACWPSTRERATNRKLRRSPYRCYTRYGSFKTGTVTSQSATLARTWHALHVSPHCPCR